MLNVTTDELLAIIGAKEVEITKLRAQVAVLQAAYTDIKQQLEAHGATTATVD